MIAKNHTQTPAHEGGQIIIQQEPDGERWIVGVRDYSATFGWDIPPKKDQYFIEEQSLLNNIIGTNMHTLSRCRRWLRKKDFLKFALWLLLLVMYLGLTTHIAILITH